MAKTAFKDSINQTYNSIIWTHKIQRTYLEVLEKRRKLFKILKIVFTATASLATATFAFFNNQIGTILSSIITAATVFFGDILDKIETKENIQMFKDSSTKLFDLKNRLLVLKDKIASGTMSEEMIEFTIESINETYASSQRNLPTIPDSIVKMAEVKLKERKDEEIDFNLL